MHNTSGSSHGSTEKIKINKNLLTIELGHKGTNDSTNFAESSGSLKEKRYTKSRCRSQSPISDRENIANSSHSKSLDSVEIALEELEKGHQDDKECIDESNVSFSHSRELWQKRVNLQTVSVDSVSPKPNVYSRNWLQKHTPDLVMDLPLEEIMSKKSINKSSQHFYSDTSSSEEDTVSVASVETPTGPESPDMSTAAERFAKQNQCTLKKNTKLHAEATANLRYEQQQMSENVASASVNPNTVTTNSTSKPQIKAKPQLLKKPVFSFVAP